jgi:DTW domain-containing protein YfiP
VRHDADRNGVLQTERGAQMTSESAALDAVVDALWRQREALARLATALSGFGDIAAAESDLSLGEVLRSAETEELTATLGLPADASLAEIAAVTDEPWRTILLDHLNALRLHYTEVTARALLAGRRILQQSLDDFLR